MNVIVQPDYAALSHAAGDVVADVIAANLDACIVAATGNTPMGLYLDLGERHVRGEVDTSHLRIFQLDEYLGVTREDGRSLYRWMRQSLLDPLAISPDRVTSFRGDTDDPEAECRAYDDALRAAGGYDLAILGLGPNGHLGFNEPPCNSTAQTRPLNLSEESIHSNAGYWGSEERVPRRALTAGMRELLAARHILLLVSGERKRDILARTLHGPVTPTVPASFLQWAAQVTVLADAPATGQV